MKKLLTFVLALCATFTITAQKKQNEKTNYWNPDTVKMITSHIQQKGKKLEGGGAAYKLFLSKTEFLLLTGNNGNPEQLLTVHTDKLKTNVFLNREKTFSGNTKTIGTSTVFFARMVTLGKNQTIGEIDEFLRKFVANPPFPPVTFNEAQNLSKVYHDIFKGKLAENADTTKNGYSLMANYTVGSSNYNYGLFYLATSDTIQISEIIDITSEDGIESSLRTDLVFNMDFSILDGEIRTSLDGYYQPVTPQILEVFFDKNFYLKKALEEVNKKKEGE